MVFKVSLLVVLAVVLHVTVGWLTTPIAGLLAGLWIGRRGWLFGTAVGLLGWVVLVVYNFVVAPGPVWAMAETMGQLFGNLPGGAVVAVTLVIGAVLGGLGGYVGMNLRLLLKPDRAPAAV